MQQTTNSDIIAMASAVVALCALGTSVWQGILARRHNILSVRPHIDLWVRATDNNRLIVELVNHGLGPAFLTDLKVELDGRVFSIQSSAGLTDLADSIAGSLAPDMTTIHYIHDQHSSIGQGGCLQVLEVRLKNASTKGPEAQAAFAAAAARLRGAGTYTCMYGKKYQLTLGGSEA